MRLRKMSIFVQLALVSVVGLIGISAVNAQALPCYTPASLQGSYPVVATYGANVAIALEIRYFDGAGNMTGTVTVNGPTSGSPNGARTVVTAKNSGTYIVNCDGTGTINRVLTYATGATVFQTDDFVITGAVSAGLENPLATALTDAQRSPSDIVPGGLLVRRSYTRAPTTLPQGFVPNQ
jgi:hypothetical protein